MEPTILIATVALLTSGGVPLQTPPPAPSAPGAGMLEELPLAFVENRGQWDTPARFVARRGPLVARAEPRALVVQLEERDEEGAGRALVARLEFENALEDVELVGEEPQGGVRNYFVGDRARWRTGVPAFSKVVYRGLHEGIDLCLRERVGRLEYDLLLEPNARLERFVVRCEGVDGLEIEDDGSLVMQTELGAIRQSPPETWQVLPGGERRDIGCRFVLLDEKRFGFALDEHLPDLPVVIDPGLEWSTCLGGSEDDWAYTGTLDSSGRVVLGGKTKSADFPATSGSLTGQNEAFVAVLDPSQTGAQQLVWSTLVGGSDKDKIHDVEVDAAGNVFAVGSTSSTDLQCTANAYQGTPNGDWDAFVCELDGQNGTLRYLSYFGGSSRDAGVQLELEGSGVVALAGTTNSADLLTVGAYQSTKAGDYDYYIARMDLNQVPPVNQLLYSSYLGGTGRDGFPAPDLNVFAMRLVLLPSGELVLAGSTLSTNYPVTNNAYDPSYGGGRDAVVTTLDPSLGTAGLVYSTFLGGSGFDGATAADVDASGVIAVGGGTLSSNFPTTPGAFDEVFLGASQAAFLACLDPSLGFPYDQQLVYSTFLHGQGVDLVMDLCLDGEGNIVAAGLAGYGVSASNFPTTCGAYDESFNGYRDGFLLYLSPSGNGASNLLYGTFVGGATEDSLWSVDLLTNGAYEVVCTGNTMSPGFPLVNPCQTHQGGLDALALRIELNPHNDCIAAPNSAGPDGALICGTGSVSIAANTFTLSVSGGVPNETGLFYFGPNAIETPFGHGYRCVGGGVHRLNPALQMDGTGGVSRWVDLGTTPGNLLTPGVPWHFQFWYRDPAAGGAGFNFSNGLKVVFHP